MTKMTLRRASLSIGSVTRYLASALRGSGEDWGGTWRCRTFGEELGDELKEERVEGEEVRSIGNDG